MHAEPLIVLHLNRRMVGFDGVDRAFAHLPPKDPIADPSPFLRLASFESELPPRSWISLISWVIRVNSCNWMLVQLIVPPCHPVLRRQMAAVVR